MLRKLYFRDSFKEPINSGSGSPDTYDLSPVLAGVETDIGQGSGNTYDPVVVLRLAGLVNDLIYGTSFDIAGVCTTLTTDTVFRFRLLRINSGGSTVATSNYSSYFNTTGIFSSTLTFNTAWQVGDYLGIEFTHQRLAGQGQTYFEILANDADSYVELEMAVEVSEELIPQGSSAGGGTFDVHTDNHLDITTSTSNAQAFPLEWSLDDTFSVDLSTASASAYPLEVQAGVSTSIDVSTSTNAVTEVFFSSAEIDFTTVPSSTSVLTFIDEQQFYVYRGYNDAINYTWPIEYNALSGDNVTISFVESTSSTSTTQISVPQLMIGLDSVASNAGGGTFDISLSVGEDMEPAPSSAKGRDFQESFITYTGVSTPYDNTGNYNDGAYEPSLGYGPEIFFEVSSSNTWSTFFEVEAILTGYLIETASSYTTDTEITEHVYSNIDFETSSSASDAVEIDYSVNYTDSPAPVASSTQTYEVTVKTDNNITLEPEASLASGNTVFAQRVHFNEAFVTSTSTANGISVEWAQSQSIELASRVTYALGRPLTIDEDVYILIEPVASESVALTMRSYGGLQDRMRGKISMGRRARPFAMT